MKYDTIEEAVTAFNALDDEAVTAVKDGDFSTAADKWQQGIDIVNDNPNDEDNSEVVTLLTTAVTDSKLAAEGDEDAKQRVIDSLPSDEDAAFMAFLDAVLGGEPDVAKAA